MEVGRRTRLELLDEIATLRRQLRELEAELARSGAAPELLGGQERLHRHLVESSLGFMCVHDFAGVLLYVNPAAAQALQWTPEDGVGRNLREYLAPSAAPFFDDYLERIRRNPTDSGQMLLVAKDGTEQIWSYRNVKLEEPAFPVCVLGHAMDVTEHVRTRHALRETHEALEERDARYQSLLEGAPVGVCIDQDGLVRIANTALARMHGYASPADLVGRSSAMLVAASDQKRVERYRAAVARGERTGESLEAEHVRRDGSLIWVERWSAVVPWERRPALLMTLIDITDRKRLEARVRQTERLESVGRLAGGVAHHLNNLMTVVLGCGQLVKVALDEGDPRRRRVEMILGAGERAASLVQQLFAFSRRQILRPALLDVSRFLSTLAPRVRDCAGQHVEVELALASAPWPVNADAAQLEYTVLALVANARDAMPHGGRVTLRTANVLVEPMEAAAHPGMRPGAYVLLTVEDTGTGMTEEVRARIFEPFFSTKPVNKGTGLALASVYGIVKQHDGYIAVDSRPDVGATFRLYLPRADHPAVGGGDA